MYTIAIAVVDQVHPAFGSKLSLKKYLYSGTVTTNMTSITISTYIRSTANYSDHITKHIHFSQPKQEKLSVTIQIYLAIKICKSEKKLCL